MGHIKLIYFFLLISILILPDISTARSQPTLVFLTWKPNKPGLWNGLISKFQNKYPEIKVRMQMAPHSSTTYHAVVSQRLKNRDPSLDVFLMDVTWPMEFISAGWVMDITSRFSKHERNMFLPGPIKANSLKGKIYGVPCYIAAGMFYYRKDLLQKYNLPVPRSWHEMIEIGRKIKEKEVSSYLWIYSAQFKQYEGLVCNIMEFIWSNGGQIIDPETGEPKLDDPEVLSAIRFVRDNIIKGKASPPGILSYEEPESLNLFVQGRVIFHRNWPYAWAISNDPRMSKIAGKVGVGLLPSFKKGASCSALGGWQFGISAFSKNPDASWEFVRFMTSYSAQKSLALEAGLAPTRRALYNDTTLIKGMPHLKAFLPVFEKARPRPLSPLYPVISQELQRFFSKAITGSDDRLSDLARESSKRIKKIIRLRSRVH